MKTIVISLVALGGLFTTSCRKNYHCHCTEEHGGGGTNTKVETVNTIEAMSESRARKQCEDGNYNINTSTFTNYKHCELK
ncbi:MAG TPA: hypothetical protein VL947_11315 [Cytophagales bacterium]|nr:hypothetical protein [Cytophagales bacterium]